MESSEDEDDDSIPNTGESFEAFAQRVGTALTPKQALRITDLVPKNMISFKFNDYILTAGQSPILVCTVCGNEGHLQVSLIILSKDVQGYSTNTNTTSTVFQKLLLEVVDSATTKLARIFQGPKNCTWEIFIYMRKKIIFQYFNFSGVKIS